VHGIDDLLLEAGRELLRSIIVDHRIPALVAAFGEHSLGWNVARRVIGISRDNEPSAVELALESQRIVHHDFARQKN
jgi:hypothetical protein